MYESAPSCITCVTGKHLLSYLLLLLQGRLPLRCLLPGLLLLLLALPFCFLLLLCFLPPRRLHLRHRRLAGGRLAGVLRLCAMVRSLAAGDCPLQPEHCCKHVLRRILPGIHGRLLERQAAHTVWKRCFAIKSSSHETSLQKNRRTCSRCSIATRAAAASAAATPSASSTDAARSSLQDRNSGFRVLGWLMHTTARSSLQHSQTTAQLSRFS